MRYFLDTEFIEDGKTIDLISIGIVCEDGREFYALNLDCDWGQANEWVESNVLPKLFAHIKPGLNKIPEKLRYGAITKKINHSWWRHDCIGEAIVEFIGDDKPEFWACYAATDWVVFYQLFGRMIDLPKGFPRRCNDLMQECDRLGFDARSVERANNHNALEDARWNNRLWEALQDAQVVHDIELEKSAVFEELAKY